MLCGATKKLEKNKKALVVQSCPTLCDPMDCSPPGSSIHGILQARKLEWVVIPFAMVSSQLRDEQAFPALQADSLPLSHQGSPQTVKPTSKNEGNGEKNPIFPLSQPWTGGEGSYLPPCHSL